jgi:tetratricopeptide (TPR) repeat protein
LHRESERAINRPDAMSAGATEIDVRSLQRRAEQAIRTAKPRDYIVRLLEQIVTHAGTDIEAARFAHRHLAELRLEESPWRAALHLRRVIQLDPDDDVAHALMGLCQALQANFRTAVASFRRAVALSPGNPWYNHNLGHLLDVALGASKEALPYLRRAHKMEPRQGEVSASLAHCLGRLGAHEEALALGRSLVERDPRDPHNKALLQWLESGAKANGDHTVPGLLSAISPAAAAARDAALAAATTDVMTPRSRVHDDAGTAPSAVERLLATALSTTGRTTDDVERARTLWRDYERVARPVLGRPDVLAAAIEYALARVDGSRVKQRDIAERHGISISSLQTRYAAIRSLLRLQPRDSRYARAQRRIDEPN